MVAGGFQTVNHNFTGSGWLLRVQGWVVIALAAVLHRFAYLKQALAVLLIFIGSKIFVAHLLDLEKFPAALSLGGTFAILTAGIAYSLWRTRNSVATLKGES